MSDRSRKLLDAVCLVIDGTIIENFYRKMVRQGSGSAGDDGGTWFGYDEVGNLTIQDPRRNITTFLYDSRNRRTSATAPAPFNRSDHRDRHCSACCQ